jgi:hypothetical protein
MKISKQTRSEATVQIEGHIVDSDILRDIFDPAYVSLSSFSPMPGAFDLLVDRDGGFSYAPRDL